jgi:hypothetical protein
MPKTAKLTYYRQMRVDGGIRTGIEIDGDTVASRFEETEGTIIDPALLWYVDVRCEGVAIPRDPSDAWRWLLDNASNFKQALRDAASDLVAGVDTGAWPALIPIKKLPAKVRGVIAFSSMKRISGHDLSHVLNSIATGWEHSIRELAPAKAVHA